MRGITKHGRGISFGTLAITLAACGAPAAPGEDDLSSQDDQLQLAPATECAAPPAGTDDRTVAAFARVNSYRKMLGLPCASFVPAIATAAADHCAYYVANHGSCIANPHREVEGCKDFHAERFDDRMRAAGYTGNPAYETMTYFGDGRRAVDAWVDSVWHRIPILSPWVGDAGYGSKDACDTMDFGWLSKAPTLNAPVTYPTSGQTGVPTKFDGRTESPALPVPPKGWPSGYPVIVYAADLEVTSHTIYDDHMKSLPHVWISPDSSSSMGLLRNEVLMYPHAPLKTQTTYRVVIEGQRDGQPVHLDWTFTTRS